MISFSKFYDTFLIFWSSGYIHGKVKKTATWSQAIVSLQSEKPNFYSRVKSEDLVESCLKASTVDEVDALAQGDFLNKVLFGVKPKWTVKSNSTKTLSAKANSLTAVKQIRILAQTMKRNVILKQYTDAKRPKGMFMLTRQQQLETPLECAKRELYEETGYKITLSVEESEKLPQQRIQVDSHRFDILFEVDKSSLLKDLQWDERKQIDEFQWICDTIDDTVR